MIEITNEDNMVMMARYPDKYFDLAIVDPPYGLGYDADAKRKASYKGSNQKAKRADYGLSSWDITSPDGCYFNELQRVSKNQIIWGANHFISKIPFDSPCWIIWDKVNGENDFADCEMAWTSFKTAVRKFQFRWHGMLQGDMKNKEIRIHPTQKPVQLYKWILDKYAKTGDKIIDTHYGSGSLGIACHDYGFDLTACELDKDYYDAAMKRYNNHMAQTKLF